MGSSSSSSSSTQHGARNNSGRRGGGGGGSASRPAMTTRGGRGCAHVAKLQKGKFRALVRRKFLGEVNGSIPRSAQLAPRVDKNSPAAVLANAGAPKTGKDSLLRTQTILHCQACASDGGGKSEKAKGYVQNLVAQTKIGAICNLDIWMCMQCGEMACLGNDQQHVFQHYAKTGHPLWIQCHDSHVFCIPCQLYVYPRELSMSSHYERILDDIVYQWLLTLGRVRVWWRVLDQQDPKDEKGNPLETVRGIENFGNTCFFTSTCQALVHCSALVGKVMSAHDSGRPIQTQLKELMKLYWDQQKSFRHINPRPFFRAVQQNALFGQYGDHTMEDANSLVVDIFNGLDSKLVDDLFGFKLQSRITCRKCASVRHKAGDALSDVCKGIEERARNIILDFVFGEAPSARNLPSETMLSLGLADMSASENKLPSFKESSIGSSTARVFSLMTIHAQAGNSKSVKLADLIKRYFAKEHIPDYRCSGCKEKGGCYKEVSPRELPPVLMMQLKRFAPSPLGSQIKCHRRVEVPITLKGATFDGKSENGGQTYRLCSMVVHDGGMGGGHNMCYVRLPSLASQMMVGKCSDKNSGSDSSGGDEWMWFSDRHIGPVSPDEVAAAEPYILMYEKV
mmetsp:Transcript_27065/g.65787  ORF Transcript_27065/g.65787 Transcript_27065/m.65787 type:complete len:622 (-) Transcript_27065:120-1985(-)